MIPIVGGVLLAFLTFGILDGLGFLDQQADQPAVPTSTVAVEPETATTPTLQAQMPAGTTGTTSGEIVGLGRPREHIQSVFEKPDVGFTFEPSSDVGGQPRTLGWSKDRHAAVQLIGPPENLVSGSVIVSLSDEATSVPAQDSAYFLGLVKLVVPSWEEGTSWVHDNISTVRETGEAETTYAHLEIRMQFLADYNALVLTIADRNWAIPALATMPIPEPAQPPATPELRAAGQTATPTPLAATPVQATVTPAPPVPTVQASTAGGGTAAIDDIVGEADISTVVNLVLQSLAEHRGLSVDDSELIYDAIGRTQRSIDLLYGTGATGDVFRAAEELLLTQLDVLKEVEGASRTENLADLKTTASLLIDLGERRLVFNRQLDNEVFTPSYTQEELDVVSIVRQDEALRIVMSEVMAALAEGRPVDLEISDKVYQALSETNKGLDLIDEIGETGDVFEAAVDVLQHRRRFLIDLERAVLSGNIADLRPVVEDWVELSQKQLRFERQVIGSPGEQLNATPASSILSLDLYVSQASDEPADTGAHFYQVRQDDTLSDIAVQFDTDVAELARLNNITDERALHSGMTLIVSAPSLPPIAAPDPFYYEVQHGDTLTWIAERHGLNVDTLVQVNDLRTPDLLLPGQQLLIASRPLSTP